MLSARGIQCQAGRHKRVGIWRDEDSGQNKGGFFYVITDVFIRVCGFGGSIGRGRLGARR
jgi:hypothetical protein